MEKFMKAFLMACIVMLFQMAKAQQTQQAEIDYATNPVWIKMIDDPKTNYYEAIKAFDTYWNGKLKPMLEEEEEGISGGKESREQKREHEAYEKKLKAMTPTEKNEFDLMVYQCKRFENWKREILPYVQEDGRILTIEERIQIYNRQQDDIKNK